MALIGHWPLTGNLNDYSGNGNHGTAYGTLTINENGKIGKTYNFTNDINGVNIPYNFNGLTEYTFAAWVKPVGNHRNYNGTVMSSGNWNGQSWAFGLKQDNKAFDVGSNGYNRYINYTFELNKWYHILSTTSNGVAKAYVNGIFIGQINVSSTPLLSQDANMAIGRETYANGHFAFNGNINDVRIYDHILSKKEITNLVKAKVLHYTFDNPTFVRDFSGFQNHGELSPIPPVWTEDGRIGTGSFSFSSGSHYINLPNDIGYRDEFSAITWFKSNGAAGSGYHILFGGSYLEMSILANGQIRIGVHISNSRKVDNFSATLTDGEWHQVGMVYDGDYKIAYVDGVEVGRTQVGPDLTQQSFTNRRIGTFGTSTNYYANGNIDDVRIYATALSSEEIKQLYGVQTNFDNLGNVQASNFVENEILIKMKKEGIIEVFEIDEVSGTANPNAQQEETKTGTLKINGEFSEVD